MILTKILGCQVLLPSPNSKLLEKTFFFHLTFGFETWQNYRFVVSFSKLLELLINRTKLAYIVINSNKKGAAICNDNTLHVAINSDPVYGLGQNLKADY